jgi:hypothetical protein
MPGICVLCLFLVQHRCPKLICCSAFFHVKYMLCDCFCRLVGHIMLVWLSGTSNPHE